MGMVMKVGDRVETEYGPGTITAVEEWSRVTRYGLKLDNLEAFSWQKAGEPLFFFESELRLLPSKKKKG